MPIGSFARRARRTVAVAAVAALVVVGPEAARGDGETGPKLSLVAPAEAAWVGGAFVVKGTLSGAPKGSVVKLGDQFTTTGEDGGFEFRVIADGEGERGVMVSFTPPAGPRIEVTRSVKVDATPPVVDAISPAAEAAEYVGESATVSGRFLDLTPLTVRVNDANTVVDANGRFSVTIPVPAKGETAVRIDATDAAGNAAKPVLRRLARWKDRGPAAMVCDEKGTAWLARDGKRVPMTGEPKKNAESIVSYEAAKGPLSAEDRPLLVPIRAKAPVIAFAVARAIDALAAIPTRVAIVAPAPESANAKVKADVVDVYADPKDGAMHVRCAEKESVFSADDVRALSAPGAGDAAAAVRRAIFAMGTSLQFDRDSSVIRVRMREPVDARFLAEVCTSGFRNPDVILELATGALPKPLPSAVPPGVPGMAAPLAPADPSAKPDPAAGARTPLLRRGSLASLKPADQQAINDALAWLAAHQSPDGAWSATAAVRWCDGKEWDVDASAERGRDWYEVGVSGLALLALLGGGHSPTEAGPYGAALTAGLRYMTGNQDSEGTFGPRTTGHWLYGHAIATMAVIEAFGVTGDPALGASAQKGIDLIAVARNPKGAWRYGIKPGDNDTSITGWTISALEMARRVNAGAALQHRPAPFVIDDEAFDGALGWIDRMVDAGEGRGGYQTKGSGPARTAELVDTFPCELSESLTAIALMVKIYCGATKRTAAGNSFDRGMALLAALPPSLKAPARDMYYWYYGSIVMQLTRGAKKYAAMAKDWDAAIQVAVTGTQVKKGTKCGTMGSWEADDVWGPDGGRVYSTAICALILEAPIRFP